MIKTNKRIVLLDAQAILHRAYHALPDFASSKGEPTGALYGLSLMLLKIIPELKPDYIAACFDVKEPTYRHEAYEGYKATRKKTDDELIFQINKSKDIFKAFGIPVYEKPGFEADDLIGTINEILKNDAEIEVVIASGDMDTLQLVSGDKTRVYTLKKGIKDTIIYNEKAVLERFGFEPTLLPDYKGLRGDPSDNIIGIKGIGEKGATELIKEFGTIENIYLELKKGEEVFLKKGFKKRLIELLLQNEEEALFSKMLGTIKKDVPLDFNLEGSKWRGEETKQDIVKIFGELEFRTLRDRVEKNFFKNSSDSQNSISKPSQNSLILEQVPRESVDVQEQKETAVALWLIDSNITTPTIEDILSYAGTKSFSEAKKIIFQKLEKSGLLSLYEKIEKPLIRITEKMGERGVKIDAQFLRELSVEYHKTLNKLEKQIWSGAKSEFNINSPKQLSKVLFEDLGLTIKNQRKTGGGAKSTKESELQKMMELHPIIPLILDYRELQKLLSTYIDSIQLQLGKDSRLHAQFNQTGATTGRMSSENPNLQNIPIKTDLGKVIRKAFVAESGFLLATFDYSQIELRIAAFLSRDEKLIKIFKEKEDVHTAVASLVFDVPSEKVDREMRRRAKVINFGIIYGMGVNALRANLKTSREEATKFLEEYFNNFSTLKSYLESIKVEALKTGYTETFFGRKRYFPGLRSKLPFLKASAERMAVNAPLQGTSADITKIAMTEVDKYIEKNNLSNDVFLLLQIHDELIYEIREGLAGNVAVDIKKIMEGVIGLKETAGVPLIVNVGTGKNWGEMKTI
ncbi:MAG: DNA polymerase [Patescibacteria group bacterium]